MNSKKTKLWIRVVAILLCALTVLGLVAGTIAVH